jgi:transmembrane sensor
MKKLRYNLDLITRHLLNETDNTEEEMIKDVINNDEKSRREFDEYLDLWEKSADVKDFDKIDDEHDWRQVRARMNFGRIKRSLPLRTYFLRIAAVLILAFGLASIFHYFNGPKAHGSEYYETATVNEMREVKLPEGSVISLNRNSKIVRNSEFGKSNRDIILEGEAFFEVAKNPNLPFKVYTKNSTIEVTGTSFNIKSDTFQVIVGVLTGKVAFYQTGNTVNRIDLLPEKTGYYKTGNHSFVMESSLDPNSIAWHTGRLIFKKTPVSEVFKIIAGYFNKELIIEAGAPTSVPFNGSFDKQSLEEMIEDINMTLPEKLDVVTTDSRLIVKKR